jgi:Aminoglycoside-2''-adenylyltransferase
MTAFVPEIEAWEAWRPEEVTELLGDIDVPWYVAAGWAIDLFLGEDRREHEDLEIAVPNVRFDEVAERLEGFDIFVITGPAEATALAEARDRLADTHQTWIREPGWGKWRFDIFREPSDGDTWICRREPALRMPYARLIEHSDGGIPYGRPEVILFFKAKHAQQEKNERDFADTLPRLDGERRGWLRDALELVHPGHAWLEELGT